MAMNDTLSCNEKISLDEKIVFINKYHVTKDYMSKMTNLVKEFRQDMISGVIKANMCGVPHKRSLKAWLRRVDTEGFIDENGHIRGTDKNLIMVTSVRGMNALTEEVYASLVKEKAV